MLRFFFIWPRDNLSGHHRCDHTVLRAWWFLACAFALGKNRQKAQGRITSTTAHCPILCVELESFKRYFLTPWVNTIQWSWGGLCSCDVSLPSNAKTSSVCTSEDLIKHVEGGIDSYLIRPRMAQLWNRGVLVLLLAETRLLTWHRTVAVMFYVGAFMFRLVVVAIKCVNSVKNSWIFSVMIKD